MKKLNKKGFTLVELLAVIVVLALLMVVAASSIGSALKNAKKNTLKTEAQKIVTNIYQNAYSQYTLTGSVSGLTGYTSVVASSDDYVVTGEDGDYTFTVKVSESANLLGYCINYNTDELNITETGLTKTGAPTISKSLNVAEGACTPIS